MTGLPAGGMQCSREQNISVLVYFVRVCLILSINHVCDEWCAVCRSVSGRGVAGGTPSSHRRHRTAEGRHLEADAPSRPTHAAATPHHRVLDGDRATDSAAVTSHVPACVAPRPARATLQPMAADDWGTTGSGRYGK